MGNEINEYRVRHLQVCNSDLTKPTTDLKVTRNKKKCSVIKVTGTQVPEITKCSRGCWKWVKVGSYSRILHEYSMED